MPGSAGEIFRVIRSSESTSRASLAQLTGLAPSTVSLRVESLIRLGLVRYGGDDESNGGRRARLLEVDDSAGFVVGVEVGSHHLKIVLADLAGRHLRHHEQLFTLREEPAALVAALWECIGEQIASGDVDAADLMGIGISLPAPIEYPSGRIVLPSFLPSLHDAVLADLFAAHTSVPVLVENDANLMAFAERSDGDTQADQLLVVRLGSRIGCGILSAGHLHRGIHGAAGEISHTAVGGTATISCTCSTPDCLESVASGGALVARLASLGYDVETTSDVVELGVRGDQEAVAILREAGARIGQVLASIVNFFNPRDVVLGGSMSASPILVAAIRAEVFQRCLPLVADDLDIRAARDPSDSGIRGAVDYVLEGILAPSRIDALVRAQHEDAELSAS